MKVVFEVDGDLRCDRPRATERSVAAKCARRIAGNRGRTAGRQRSGRLAMVDRTRDEVLIEPAGPLAVGDDALAERIGEVQAELRAMGLVIAEHLRAQAADGR